MHDEQPCSIGEALLDGVVIQGVDVLIPGGEDGAINRSFLRCVARVIEVPVDVVEEPNVVVVQLWRRVHEGGQEVFQLRWRRRRSGMVPALACASTWLRLNCIIVAVRELAAKSCRASKTAPTTSTLRIILVVFITTIHASTQVHNRHDGAVL
ncbi:hypothetical protein VYU27_001516 [Nannochloropsis oceanica]